MSEIKALDKLRKLKEEVYGPRWGVEFDRVIDELEAEIAERYQLLPVDADGVPIHVGDKLMTDDKGSSLYGRELLVTAVSEHHVHYQVLPYEGDGHYRTSYLVSFHHVKPRTLEDVLRECGKRYHAHMIDNYMNYDGTDDPLIAKYADEIRAMFGEVDHG